MKSRRQKNLDISQTRINEQIYSYLTQNNRSPEFTSLFSQSSRLCNGLATLAIYAQYLESIKKEDTFAHSTDELDDWRWLKATLRKFSAWNRDLNTLSSSEEYDIERLIALIIYPQYVHRYRPIGQGNLHLFLEDTANRQLKLDYRIAGMFTSDDFTKRLKFGKGSATTLIHILTQYPNRLILVSSGRHSLGLFVSANKSKKQFSLYDGLSKKGRRVYDHDEMELLVNAIFKAYKYNPLEHSPLGFRIFTFDDSVGTYPRQKTILNKFNHPFTSVNESKKVDYSALHISTRIDANECIKYYLNKGASIDTMMGTQTTPLYLAVIRNHEAIAKIYVYDGKANINKRCQNNLSSPLIQASRRGLLRIVKMMLEHPFHSRFKNLVTALKFLPTNQMRNELINSLHKNTLSKMVRNKTLAKAQLKRYESSKYFNVHTEGLLMLLLDTHNVVYQREQTPHGLRFFPTVKVKAAASSQRKEKPEHRITLS